MNSRPCGFRAAFAGLLVASALGVVGTAAPALALSPTADSEPGATAMGAEVKTTALVHSAPNERNALSFSVGKGTKVAVDCWVQGDASYFKLTGGEMFVKTIHVKIDGDPKRLPRC